MAYVYLIGETNDSNKFKIGVTNGDIEKRIKKLQTGNSQELYIKSFYQTKYPFKLEKMLHRHFFKQKILNEWFLLNDEEIINFNEICEKYNQILLSLNNNPFFNKKST